MMSIPKASVRPSDSVTERTHGNQKNWYRMAVVCYNRVLIRMSQGKEHTGQKPGKPGIGSWVSLPSGVTQICLTLPAAECDSTH